MATRIICTSIIVCLAAVAAGAEPGDLNRDMVLRLDMAKGSARCIPAKVGPPARSNAEMTFQDGALLSVPTTDVTVPDDGTLDIGDALTLSVWIVSTPEIDSYRTLLFKGHRAGADTQQVRYCLSLCNGCIEFKFQDAKGRWQGIVRNGDQFHLAAGKSVPMADVPAVKPGHWTHVAATFERGAVRTFLNGRPVLAGRATVDKLTPGREPLRIGMGQTAGGHKGYVFRGLMDDVRIYGRALDPSELARLYEAERADKTSDRVVVRQWQPPGYDPQFKNTLRLTAEYAKRLDSLPLAPPVREAGVQLHRGAIVMQVNGEPVYPMAMMPSPYVPDAETTLSCRDFAAAGVDIYSDIFWSWISSGDGCKRWWLAPGEYDFRIIDDHIASIVAANPNARIFPRVKLNPPVWWLKQHPDHVSKHADGTSGGQVSLASPLWEQAYERMLRDFIRHVEAGPHAGNIIGYHPAGGSASEWFWWKKSGKLIDYSPVARARFQEWLRTEYGGDVARLRQAWRMPEVTFETAEPPDEKMRTTSELLFFRDPLAARRVSDFRRFLSAMVSRNIVRSCRIVKEETKGRKLAGVFYGYSIYTTGILPNEGFQGLAEVLASPHVDFLASPTSYDARRGGDPGYFVSSYTASYRLHGKLYWDEVDTRTHLYPQFVGYRTNDLAETLAAHQRAVGWSLTKGTGLWWFLLAGNATFHQDAVMDDIAALDGAVKRSLAADRTPVAQVAVFADERSMHSVNNTNRTLHRALLHDTRDELARMGAPSDIYLLDDIADPRLPDYKLYVFLNAFHIDQARRDAISARVRQRGRVAAWVYAPGFITDAGFSEAAMKELTGITLRHVAKKQQVSLTVTNKDHPLTRALVGVPERSVDVGPLFFAEDPDALVLGTVAGKPGLVVKEFDNWRSVYSSLPLKREVLLGLCRYAGVHVYCESFDTCSANKSYIMLHTSTPGHKVLHLPRRSTVSDAVTQKPIAKDTDKVEFDLPAGVTKLLRLQ